MNSDGSCSDERGSLGLPGRRGFMRAPSISSTPFDRSMRTGVSPADGADAAAGRLKDSTGLYFVRMPPYIRASNPAAKAVRRDLHHMLNDIYNKRIIELAGNIPRLGRLADPHASATAPPHTRA